MLLTDMASDLGDWLTETPLSTLSGYVAGLFGVWYITTAFAAWYPLRHIPGPFLGSFSFLWDIYYATGRVERLATIHDDYAKGALVRIAPNQVVTNDP